MTEQQPTPQGRQDLSPERAANLAENPHAGQGAVMLDIGGDIGAVIVHLPAHLEGAEIEYEQVTHRAADLPGHDSGSEHEHSHGHEAEAHDHASHDQGHDHGHGHGHGHGHPHRPHVAVVGRPTSAGAILYSAVFPELREGDYVLHEASTGQSRPVTVVGGVVTELDWEASAATPAPGA